MERLDFLVRRFRQILPEPLIRENSVARRRIRCWLTDDVRPVLEEYLKRPRFQDLAAWPVRTLRVGMGTVERALVDEVDVALVAHGRALKAFAGHGKANELLQSVAIEDFVAEEEVSFGPNGPRVTRQVRKPHDRLATVLQQLSAVEGRFWRDLVCLEDYFEPYGGMMAGTSACPQRGEFVVSLNPELHAGGDFISRCLCQRVNVICGMLDDLHQLAQKAFRLAGGKVPKAWDRLKRERQDLTLLTGKLREACLQGNLQPLRDACILCAQVAAVLCPGADLTWLGLSDAFLQHGSSAMGYRLLHSCDGELLERFAVSLGELKNLYADGDEQQSALEEAIATGGLVIVRPTQEVFWEGKQIRINWKKHQAVWRFFRVLAEHRKANRIVTEADLYEKIVSRSTLPTTFSRLKKLVPASCWKHIEPTRDPHGYRLELDRKGIHLF